MKYKNKRGFSLIELVIAIAILVILTGLLAPQFMKYLETARTAKKIQKMDTLRVVLEAAYLDAIETNKDNTGGDTIFFTKGKVVEGSKGEIDETLLKYMTETLGEKEISKTSVFIYTYGEKKTLYNLSDFYIHYYPDIDDNDNYYYYSQGLCRNSKYPGGYGEYINGSPVVLK